MKTVKTLIAKQKSNAFGKDIYLFGIGEDGTKYWLEAPQWDCGWYWGFGYIETYTNNRNPSKSKDIQSHQHFSGFVGSQEKYNFEKQCFVKGEYIHNVWNNDNFTGLTFNEKTGWDISELFEQFHLLRKMADFCHKKPVAGCNLTTVKDVDHGDMTELYDKINKEMIPRITAKILEYLSPE